MLLNARDCGFLFLGRGVLLALFDVIFYVISWHLIHVLLVAQDFMCVVIGMWFFLSGRSENGSSHRSSTLSPIDSSVLFLFPFFSDNRNLPSFVSWL